jgi:hypothetical protein
MTTPTFTTVTDKQDAGDKVYLPWARCKGKLLIVRPLEYQKEGFVTANAPDGTDAVFVDVALLDPILAAVNEEGDALPAFAEGTQFRGQVVLAAYLKGTFKRYLGKTLIGTIYRGVPTKGKPPIMWQDLSTDAGCAQRGQAFLVAHQEFLVPVEAAFVEAVPEQMSGPPAYQPPPRPGAGTVYTQHSPGAGPATQNTLDQMRAMAAANAQQDPPF